MPTVIGYHDVKDTDHWLASPKRQEFFGPLGITNIRTFVDPQQPTRVALMMDVPDMDALQNAMQSEAAGAAIRTSAARRGRRWRRRLTPQYLPDPGQAGAASLDAWPRCRLPTKCL